MAAKNQNAPTYITATMLRRISEKRLTTQFLALSLVRRAARRQLGFKIIIVQQRDNLFSGISMADVKSIKPKEICVCTP